MKLAPIVVATAVVGIVVAPGAHADSSSITVPKTAPKTVSITFTGTFPLGTNMDTYFTGEPSCADSSFKSEHPFTVIVPAGAYKANKAKMTVAVESSPVLAGDFIELVDPRGTSVGMDGQHPEDVVEVSNPVAGTWKLVTCEFVPDAPGDHAYQATVTIKTKKR